jgi:H+/Cl- antiporter ClcA
MIGQWIGQTLHIDLKEQGAFLRILARWIVLGGVVGILAGTASAVFLTTLNWVTAFRLQHPEMIIFLPLAGFVVGWTYYRFARPAMRGNNLVLEVVNLDEAEAMNTPIPRRMALMVLVGTLISHLFGASVGREGTAIQMGSSLADGLRRLLGLNPADRRLMILAGISGGFGSVFGTPVAGFVFGLEVQSLGRIGYEGVIPCLVAAVVGDLVTRAWGVTHSHYPMLPTVELDPLLLAKVILGGICFGLTSLVFIELTHIIKRLCKRFLKWPPLYPVIGGIVVLLLTAIVGTQDYLGLGLPLIQNSLNGTGVVPQAFLLKLIFTSVSLGFGFVGGEVTPLFLIGSTLGYTLGHLLAVDPVLMAVVGFVAVFAGASNTPLACALMGVELFGGGALLYLVVGCFIAYFVSGHRGIYVTQRLGIPKTSGIVVRPDENLEQFAERRSNHGGE